LRGYLVAAIPKISAPTIPASSHETRVLPACLEVLAHDFEELGVHILAMGEVLVAGMIGQHEKTGGSPDAKKLILGQPGETHVICPQGDRQSTNWVTVDIHKAPHHGQQFSVKFIITAGERGGGTKRAKCHLANNNRPI